MSESKMLMMYFKFMVTQPLKFLSIMPNWFTALGFLATICLYSLYFTCGSIALGFGTISLLMTLMTSMISSGFMIMIYGEDYLTNNFKTYLE